MFELKLTSTINAGVIFDFGGKRIWVDAVHDYKTKDFSSLTPEQVEALFADSQLNAPDLILFTHNHPDHCSAEITNRALEKWPNAKVIAPEKADFKHTEFSDAILSENGVDEYEFDGLHITFFRLTHDSARFADTPHRGILLEHEDKTLLFPGDVSLKSEELFDFLKDRPLAGGRIFAAFLNFPWLCLEQGRRNMIRLNAKHYILDHLPLEKDDHWGYRKQFMKILEQFREVGDLTALSEPFTAVIIK